MNNWRKITERNIEIRKRIGYLEAELECLQDEYEDLKYDYEDARETIKKYEAQNDGYEPCAIEIGDFNDYEYAKSEYRDLISKRDWLLCEYETLKKKYSELEENLEYARLTIADYEAE